MGLNGRLIGVVAALLLALGARVAMAETPPLPASGETASSEGPSRAEYVSGLEKICKPGSDDTVRVMKGVKSDVNHNRLKVALEKFEKATKIFSRTTASMESQPRPPADEARLEKWFTFLNRQQKYLEEISTQLRAGNKHKAQRLIPRFIHNGNEANNVTLAFGFNYCRFKFIRYGI